MAMEKMTEKELAIVANLYYEKRNWDMFPEVCFSSFGGRPDFVGKKNNLCMVVECKLTLGFSVLEQLTAWCSESFKHYSVDARDAKMGIPNLLIAFVQSTGRTTYLREKAIEDYGIGVINVQKVRTFERTKNGKQFFKNNTLYMDEYSYHIYERNSPKIQPGSRKTAYRLIAQLNDDMKIAEAGAKSGETQYITPFRRTMNRVYKIMNRDKIKEYHVDHLVSGIHKLGGHHYVSDKNAAIGISAGLLREEIVLKSRDYGPWYKLKES
jgi:hypothetical protein